MRFPLLIALVAFAFPLLTFGQLANREVTELRKKVKIGDKAIVRNSPGTDLPKVNKLRVFLAVTIPGSDQKWFRQWIGEWNRDNGATYGLVEEVGKIEDADAVLTQFIAVRSKMVETSSLGLKVQSKQRPGDKAVVLDLNEYDVESLNLPIYSYLLLREDDLWTILYSDVEASDPEQQVLNPSHRLWRAFNEKLRSR